ncbi:MAG TPA: hypothetical protein DD713_06645 [Nitrospiraceae bacterium]|nr:hypothetical protein [Nitrospiraceae bacterium]
MKILQRMHFHRFFFYCLTVVIVSLPIESAPALTVENKLYSIILEFDNSYGMTNFDDLLREEGFRTAYKKGGNNVPRALAATALVHSFIYSCKENNKRHLEKAIYLVKGLLDRYPLWTSSLLKPDISFNLAPTTAYNIGLASWLIWDEMDASLKAAVKEMLVKESDYSLLREPASGFLKDTKADENAVVPPLLVLSALLFPDEANAQKWEEHGHCYAYHSITTGKDSSFCSLKTITAHDDFTMDNHGFGPHPLYMAAPLVLFADAALVYMASGKAVPYELKHNVLPLWKRIKDFVDGDFRWTTKNSWDPTGLSREVSAVTFVSVVLGIDSEFELKLIDHKFNNQNNIIEKEVGKVKKLADYDESFFNNAIVAKRYVVSILLHKPEYLIKPPLSMK